jgi:outer membrane protein TolC
VEVARSQRRPSIGLNVLGLLRNPVTFAGRFLLSLGADVAQTLFDSGRARSQVAEARAVVDQLRNQLAGQRLEVANDIEQALLAFDSAEKRLTSADVGVISAREAVRAAQIGYAAGVSTALEVSDAQSALLAAETEAVNARFDVAGAQAQLAAAVGVLPVEGQTAYQRAVGATSPGTALNNRTGRRR